MKIKHLLEGAEPKLPGAPKGIKIMTPQQFVAKAGDAPGEESEEGVAEGLEDKVVFKGHTIGHIETDSDGDPVGIVYSNNPQSKRPFEIFGYEDVNQLKQEMISQWNKRVPKGVAEGSEQQWRVTVGNKSGTLSHTKVFTGTKEQAIKQAVRRFATTRTPVVHAELVEPRNVAEGLMSKKQLQAQQAQINHFIRQGYVLDPKDNKWRKPKNDNIEPKKQQGVAEGEDHLARIRKLSGLEEATKLPAQSREFGGQEFQDYMNRIAGSPDLDKEGNVKLDKKGNEKYVSGKTKSDRYKMPYIHRSSVITYLSPDGKTYDEEAVKKTLAIRPKALLKQNEKMKHSNGEFEQFFNVGFAALTGIALDEETNKLIIVNTCPGAGSCKVDCFAMKGGKVQFQGPWQSDGRILTYLLNDPTGFFNQLSAEITKESVAGKKGDKKFPNGWQTTVRWHDAGDFFSPEYLDMALKMAAKHPDVKFYAYTKMAGAALAKKPDNFIINWSEGAHTSQEKQVKASDANLDTTKNSRIVPDEIFQDLLVKDEKKNLVKGAQGQWQVQPDKLPELKQRLAKEYGLSANSILDYNEYMAKRKSIPAGMKYNVIVAPGEGDISANDPNIISTLLLKH